MLCQLIVIWLLLSLTSMICLLTYFGRAPGENGLGFYSTPEDVLQQYGTKLVARKNVIITGGYSGIGIDTTYHLAKAGASIWLPCRANSLPRCQAEVGLIAQSTGNHNLHCEVMDLGSLRSVLNYAVNWRQKGLPLHLLINNAGLGATEVTVTEDNVETVFATNHLGHFLLTNLLLERLHEGSPFRVITVSSVNHLYSKVDLDDISGFNTWRNGSWIRDLIGGFTAYSQSKTANILFAVALARRIDVYPRPGFSYSLHPGTIRTPLVMDSIFGGGLANLEWLLDLAPIWKTPAQGAATTIYAAVAPIESQSGHYFADCQDTPVPQYAKDERIAEALWTLSEQLVDAAIGKDWRNKNVNTNQESEKQAKTSEVKSIPTDQSKKTDGSASHSDWNAMPISCPGPPKGKPVDDKAFTGQCPL